MQLQGVARAIVHLGLMAHGLAVCTNGTHLLRAGVRVLQQLLHHVGIDAADGIAGQCSAGQFVHAVRAVQCQQFLAQGHGEFQAGMAQDLNLLAAVPACQYTVHPIERGA